MLQKVTVIAMLTISAALVAPAAQALSLETDLVEVPSSTSRAGWVEQAIALVSDIVGDVSTIGVNAVVAACRAATAACPL